MRSSISAASRPGRRLAFLPLALLTTVGLVADLAAQVAIDAEPSTRTSSRGDRDSMADTNRVAANPQVVSRALAMLPGNTPLIEELDLLDYQVEQVKAIRIELQKALGEAAKTASKVSGSERRRVFNGVYAEVDRQLQAALLPQQQQRLKQVALQSFGIQPSTRQVDIANLVGNSAIQSELGLSNATMKEIRAKMLAESKRMAEELERLRREARQNVLQVLSEEERGRLQEMIGEPFDFRGFKPGRHGEFTNQEDH